MPQYTINISTPEMDTNDEVEGTQCEIIDTQWLTLTTGLVI